MCKVWYTKKNCVDKIKGKAKYNNSKERQREKSVRCTKKIKSAFLINLFSFNFSFVDYLRKGNDDKLSQTSISSIEYTSTDWQQNLFLTDALKNNRKIREFVTNMLWCSSRHGLVMPLFFSLRKSFACKYWRRCKNRVKIKNVISVSLLIWI